ncbi:MAG: acetyl-coenzyme A synthetase N-terminal domain-containing protein, partial [Ilumatobacteraceae bacterium]
MSDALTPLWTPAPDARSTTRLGQFMDVAGTRAGRDFEDYTALWNWSVDEVEQFWATVWDFFEVHASVPYRSVMSSHHMPGVRWFEGARLNYAERALAERGAQLAVVGRSQTVDPIEWSRDQLHTEVARARAGLVRLGVTRGDRVAAY